MAWLDVTRSGEVEAVLADLRTGDPADEPAALKAWLGSYRGGPRIELYSHTVRYDRLADLVAGAMRRTGVVWRAVVFLDHDEYGAEHVVLTRDDAGLVRRIHHVFVYPYDEDTDEHYVSGEPPMTGVPAAPGAGPGSTLGAAIDNPVARAIVADLFGVSANVMEAAAERAARDLPVVSRGPSVWLEALGLDRVGAGGGAPINLRPGPVWRDAVARHLVPRLPGRWLPRDYDLVRLPASPVMCLVWPGDWQGDAVIHPMYVAKSDISLQFRVVLRSAVADTAPDPIEPLLNDLTVNALPFFDRYGHPDGLRELCQERVNAAPAGRPNPHDLQCLAATEVILGRYTEAAATYAALAAITATSSAGWAKEIGEEARVRSLLLQHQPTVVHHALTATIDQQMTYLGLPTAQ